ncbi:MAG: hypothetical protein HY906_01800 [Deltaproteobacteria bacterium]|nr:hypothetical protein [Deltaproteobacteria bacterium]
MAVAYELFLRARDQGTIEVAALEREIAALGPGLRAERFVGEGGDPEQPRGVDLALEEGESIERLLDAAFRLARTLGLEVFDPNSGEAVSEAQRDRVAAHYAEVCAYRADTLGEVGRQPLPAPATPASARTRVHVWLIVAGIIVAFLLLARGCRWFV